MRHQRHRTFATLLLSAALLTSCNGAVQPQDIKTICGLTADAIIYLCQREAPNSTSATQGQAALCPVPPQP